MVMVSALPPPPLTKITKHYRNIIAYENMFTLDTFKLQVRFRCICGEVQQGLGVYVEKYSRV